jgi:hypothetical protein
MSLGEFEPEVWVPARAAAADRGVIDLSELTGMDVVHGPRRASPGSYDAWLEVLRSVRPDFEFTDPPLRHAPSVALAFAASADRLTAVLTGPLHAAAADEAGDAGGAGERAAADTYDMVRVRLDGCPLTATAAIAWNGDLPRHLQQVLFDTADRATLSAVSAVG